MWHTKQIEKFLADRRIEPAVAESIRGRMTEVADNEGFFFATELSFVMGDVQLARAYNEAWATDSSLREV